MTIFTIFLSEQAALAAGLISGVGNSLSAAQNRLIINENIGSTKYMATINSVQAITDFSSIAPESFMFRGFEVGKWLNGFGKYGGPIAGTLAFSFTVKAYKEDGKELSDASNQLTAGDLINLAGTAAAAATALVGGAAVAPFVVVGAAIAGALYFFFQSIRVC